MADFRYYQFDDFTLDAEEGVLYRDGEQVPLTRKVFDLLLLLVRSEGRVLQPELNFTRCTMRWSPDARSLLVVAQQAPTKSGIYGVDVHTENVTTIIEPTEDVDYLLAGARCSRDGRGIFYVSF